ncbi:MAG: hypothetical protein IT379_42035 [Deltaproteobacteria bacterium]|nr:hypothetical protein [Deltaproteobacteria bacterium]
MNRLDAARLGGPSFFAMPDTGHTARRATSAALRWLASRTPSGEVPCLVAEHPSLEGAVPDSNYFAAAQALWSLAAVEGAAPVVRRLIRFVESGALHTGAWRFWTPKTYRPLDPDTDMTACAAAAIRAVGVSVPATTTEMLLAARSSERFVTWVRGPDAPNDVCAVVNANVVWYLGQRAETAATLEWLLSLVMQPEASLPLGYYDTPLFLHHAVSRAYADGVTRLGAARAEMLSVVGALRHSGGAYGNPLETALALCTLANLGERDPDTAEWLLGAQRADASWPEAAFWNGPEQPAPRSLWWGSAELTTAVVLEALRPYLAVTAPRSRDRSRGRHAAR